MPASRSVRFLLFAALAVALVLLFAAPALAGQSQIPVPAAGQATAQAKLAAGYGHIPLSFEANRGQTDPSVQFLSRGRGYTLFLRQGEAVLALRGGKLGSARAAFPGDLRGRFAARVGEFETSYVRMKLIGANPRAAAHEEDAQITKTNYFIGNDPAKWRTNVPNFGRVRYSEIYPGIDLVYYGNQSRLEHDFVVNPGADPSKIRLAINGAKKLSLDPSTGDLIVSTGNGEMRLLKPASYQESGGQRTAVSSTYRLLARNQVGFTVPSYRHARALVIDPVLVYSTLLGGSGTTANGDQGNGIVVDSEGDAYVVGATYSSDFPVTGNAFESQNASSAGSTVFVTEMNPTGTALIYSTYLGGSGGDFGYAIAIDSSNNVYVAGATYSTDFPVTCGAMQTANPSKTPGATVGFAAKLNTTGDALLYSTYLGGRGATRFYPAHGDAVQAVAIDAKGDAFLTGYTASADFPSTDGAFQTQLAAASGLSNAFVTKLNRSGTAPVYSTFLGGKGQEYVGDFGNAIVIDASGDAYVGGGTASTNFPVTSGALQSSLAGTQSGFLTELSPSGAAEVFSTFLGTNSSVRALALGSGGNVYASGTAGAFPVTSGLLEGAGSSMAGYCQLSEDVFSTLCSFAAELSEDGSSLEFATYLEGFATTPNALALDGAGNMYIAGSASNLSYGTYGGFQATPDALAVNTDNGSAGFLVKLSSDATVLNFATLIGGGAVDGSQAQATALALDADGNVYLTGSAGLTTFPTTAGAFQTVNNSPMQGNAFISKFALAAEDNQVTYPVPTGPIYTLSIDFWGSSELCANPLNFQYSFTVTYNWELEWQWGPPAPTGSVSITNDVAGDFNYSFPAWDVSDSVTLYCPDCNPATPSSIDYTVSYPGDTLYLPATQSGSIDVSYCSSNSSTARPGPTRPPRLEIPLRLRPELSQRTASGDARGNRIGARRPFLGPKFPAPPRPSAVNRRPALDEEQGRQVEACVAGAGPLLTVRVAPVSRPYGTPNPSFNYSVTGLQNGDQVTVNITTSATQSSPPGSYPLTLTLTGDSVSKYSVREVSTQLTITPVELTLTPNDVYQFAATPLGPFPYTLTGFVNGETASVLTGEPTLTAVVPVHPGQGSYVINSGRGTLKSANYTFRFLTGILYLFDPISAGMVRVGSSVSPSISFRHGPPNPPIAAQVLTDGAVKTEFSNASAVWRLEHLQVSFHFAPHAPGLWTGAFDLLNQADPTEKILSVPVYGVGTGPQSVFDAGPQIQIAPLGAAALSLPDAVTVDESGSVFIADAAAGKIVKIDFDHSASTVSLPGIQLNAPGGIAIDGEGNLYIADTGNNRVIELSIAGQARVLATPGIVLSGPRGLALDGSGDLFIANTGANEIVKVTAAGEASVFHPGLTGQLSVPSALAVDTSGDLFIADTGNNRIVEANERSVITVATGKPALSGPTGIAVDPAGTLYITQSSGNLLIAVSSSGAQTKLLAGGLSNPHGIALDHSGNLYLADTGRKRVLELFRSGEPVVHFGSAVNGKQSADSPKTIALRNIGNTALTISSVGFPTDFREDAAGNSTDCKAGTMLPAGNTCTLTIDFKPTAPVTKGSTNSLKESVRITSNTLDAPGTVQLVLVEGTEVP